MSTKMPTYSVFVFPTLELSGSPFSGREHPYPCVTRSHHEQKPLALAVTATMLFVAGVSPAQAHTERAPERAQLNAVSSDVNYSSSTHSDIDIAQFFLAGKGPIAERNPKLTEIMFSPTMLELDETRVAEFVDEVLAARFSAG